MSERKLLVQAGGDAREMETAPTLGGVLASFVRRPRESLVRQWNWKSAVLGSLIRGLLFFFTNLSAGAAAAAAAFATELAYRGCTSGFYGALTQGFSRVRPAWRGTLAACVLLPFANHSLEFFAHWMSGTQNLWVSIAASMGLTVVSTAFHVFVMRRGLLTVGDGSQSLAKDLVQMPKSVGLFAAYPFTRLYRLAKPALAARGSSKG